MIYKKYLVVICLFLIVFVSGCTRVRVRTIESIFERYDQIIEYDISYSQSIDKTNTVNNFRSNEKEEGRVVRKVVDGIALVYVHNDHRNKVTDKYYLNGYECVIRNNYYSVSDDFVIEYFKPLSLNLDLDSISYKLSVEKIDGNIIYTIESNDENLQDFVGVWLEDIDIQMVMKLTVDDKNELKSQEIDFTLTYLNTVHESNTVFTVNAIGEDVVFEVPSQVNQSINQFIEDNMEPEPVYYIDSDDGVVKYYNIGDYKQVLYDQATDKVIVLKKDHINIYNAQTMVLEKEMNELLTPNYIDVENGNMIVSYKTNSFRIYDLKSYDYTNYQTDVDVHEVVIDGDMVIYTDSRYVYFYNIPTNKLIKKVSVYQGLFVINREENILFVTETGLSSPDLIYFDTQSGDVLYKSKFMDFSHNRQRISFNGKYVQHQGRTYDRFNGEVVFDNYINKNYHDHPQIIPEITLYESDRISFVGARPYQNKTGIYDNENNQFVYNFPIINGAVSYLSNGKYLVLCGDKEYIAVVDVSLIDENLIEDERIPRNNVIVDDQSKSLRGYVYTKSIADEDYIYTLNENSRELNVYDIDSLEKVYYQRFDMTPTSLDAGNNKVIITFGEAKEFRIYDSRTWEYEDITTEQIVYNALVYGDKIFYSDIEELSKIMIYNIVDQTHSNIGYTGFYVSMAINRQDGILYLGDRNDSTCYMRYYDIENEKFIFTYQTTRNTTNVRFDGNFVYYNSLSFTNLTGTKISETEVARNYINFNHLTNMRTIFDNNNISIFTGIKDNNYITVVYDINEDKVLYSYNGRTSYANIANNTIIFLDDSQEFIRTYTLSN